jgi:hypothetical protein
MQPSRDQRALHLARHLGKQDQRCLPAGRAVACRGLRWPRTVHTWLLSFTHILAHHVIEVTLPVQALLGGRPATATCAGVDQR